jgi:hypothetical protein
MSELQNKIEDSILNARIVYLVTKYITVNINEFGDIYGKYPSVDSREETEYLEKERVEVDTFENSNTIYLSLKSAQTKAEGMFVEAKSHVNTLGSKAVIGESERDVDLNPENFKVSPLLYEDSVEFDIKVYADNETNVHSVCGFIKIVITEMTLSE